MLLPSNHEIRCFRSSCQCFVIINQWFSLLSQFLPMFSYHHTMMQILPFFLASNTDFRRFRNSCQCCVIIESWFSLFSKFLPTFCYHQNMVSVLFVVSANVLSQLINEIRCFRSSCQSSFIKPCNSLFSQFLPTFPDHQAMASL